ncbi:MAG TPA: hypothetical protein VI544_01975 [Candidatus Nanoarchaeia archaeon]|nr:hypothetical protein [Candidatus Nanoarchaeia archaeon]
MKITQDVTKGALHSAYAIGTFGAAKEELESKGYRVISLEEQAGLIVREGATSSISQRGNWTREGFIYVPTKGIFLTRASSIMANAKEVTGPNRNSKWFHLNDEQVEKSLADSAKITNTQIPTNRLADEALTNFAFGRNAKAYGEFLEENGIDNLKVCLVHSQNQPFARQAWLHRIAEDNISYLNGGKYPDDCYEVVRGVRASAEEGLEKSEH